MTEKSIFKFVFLKTILPGMHRGKSARDEKKLRKRRKQRKKKKGGEWLGGEMTGQQEGPKA